ncbi:hypothetical protein [Clostridium perfringens]|uniref:hypothetical protein n=1 Tax=Clostridium perfringens TaxID=1502 RepID=UPI000BBA63AB|nr:hypothetical protein [Clostridium perfringens]ELC8372927.1 hypothetical protein [Clostridium perfringens]MBI6062298.1 hypothetical protein [Clostridium perfringens]MCC5432224.1 hypothetical protein [Clostridium perfringens]MCC5436678.1 hypothetical protein [Clostridium perfringens]MCC5444975.1 hypothetical protein [Clostridium perfringens]
MDKRRADELMQQLEYENSYEGRLRLTYESISSEADRAIFNVISYNEEKLKEIYNSIDWSKTKTSCMKGVVLLLYVIKAMADESDYVTINEQIAYFEYGTISDIDVFKFLQKYFEAVGATPDFFKNITQHICNIVNK